MTSPFVSWTMGISSSKSEQGDFQLALLKATKPKIVHRKQMIQNRRMELEIWYYKKYWIRNRTNLVLEKVSDSDFGYPHTLIEAT